MASEIEQPPDLTGFSEGGVEGRVAEGPNREMNQWPMLHESEESSPHGSHS